MTILIGPISEKAKALRVAIPFTTDRIMPKAHWVYSLEMEIVKKGKEYFLVPKRSGEQTVFPTEPWGR